VARARLLHVAQKELDLPPAALDSIIDALGGSENVAEMTGRKGRMLRQARGRERWAWAPRAKPDSGEMDNLNVKEAKFFMNGTKLVAIISDAASTGISLHADARVPNQRRRVHLTLELAWSADKAVQQLGRSHRANQTSAPIYVLLCTDVGGEARFGSAVARRLQAMGALTKGDRRAEIGSLDAFNLDTVWGKRALKALLRAGFEGETTILPHLTDNSETLALVHAAFAGLGASTAKDRDTLEVKKFLNRMLGLPLAQQSLLFDLFNASLSAIVTNAKRDGRYDSGVADITSGARLAEAESPLWRDPVTGAQARSATIEVDRGISFDAALQFLAEAEAAALGLHGGDSAGQEEAQDASDLQAKARNRNQTSPHGTPSHAAAMSAGHESNDQSASRSPEDPPAEDAAQVGRISRTEQMADDGIRGHVRQVVAGGASNTSHQVIGDFDESDGAEESSGTKANSSDAQANERGNELDDVERGGFFRSRFKHSGEHLMVLALPKANDPSLAVLTRPNTGRSMLDEEWRDLHRKYERVLPHEASRGEWTAAYEAANHERVGGRLTRVQLLTGSTLPMLPVLEEIVKKYAPALSKRDIAISAVRVQLDGKRLLGVRFARALMEELKQVVNLKDMTVFHPPGDLATVVSTFTALWPLPITSRLASFIKAQKCGACHFGAVLQRHKML